MFHVFWSLHKHLSNWWTLSDKRFFMSPMQSFHQQILVACLGAMKANYRIAYFLIVQPWPSIKPHCFERSSFSFASKGSFWKMVLSWLVRNFNIVDYSCIVCYLSLRHHKHIYTNKNMTITWLKITHHISMIIIT